VKKEKIEEKKKISSYFITIQLLKSFSDPINKELCDDMIKNCLPNISSRSCDEMVKDSSHDILGQKYAQFFKIQCPIWPITPSFLSGFYILLNLFMS
jgi:hypothetical protein